MSIRVIRHDEVTTQEGPGGQGKVKVVMNRALAAPGGVVVVWASFAPGEQSDEHVREVDEIIYVSAGQLEIIIEDGERFQLGKRDLIYIPKGIKHQHVCKGEEPLEQVVLIVTEQM